MIVAVLILAGALLMAAAALEPYMSWLILKGQVAAGTTVLEADSKNKDWPFKPLAFGWESSARAFAKLYCGGEPMANALGDADAVFGTIGHYCKVPPESQRIWPAKRLFSADVQDLGGEEANNWSLAILGLLYFGAQAAPRHVGPDLYWLILTGTLDASDEGIFSASVDFGSFEPVAISYHSTGRAEGILKADDAPYMNQSGDLAATFGLDGRYVAIPPEGRRNFPEKTTFSYEAADLSGAENIITVAIVGNKRKG